MCLTYCVIHREALVSKEMSSGLNIVLTTVVTVVNYIKIRPLKPRIFNALCKDMGAEHSTLLFYGEARWLSCGKFLQSIHELKEEIATFLENESSPEGENFRDASFVMKMSYLVDVFKKLNTMIIANTHVGYH
ncbi:unnamed protein product [Psylliodes chrysocephalus]|uniref:Zinc finger BED domain-containing protein 5 n=1 Tax=Psylliodes chrysocephalus TaxID=3402493 RepID=A0A9P0D4Z4_9CUCU|nr:unnamed protein product [Psylliodes chrysocephala]